ncbi:MAG: septal ring lytic transglycosylase RlpA family protein [Nitrosomonadales bacterium]|nr:septal ring lytic transglycosylase RlpA family protein [Nitrosomonadales bacterium]
MKTSHILAIVFLSLFITACGSSKVRPDAPKIDRSSTGSKPVEPVKPSTGGGYYLDDGPGEISVAELERIPDAIPRAEPLRPANTRPYKALGKDYVPMKDYRPYRQRGVASWYGKRYHGNLTASGEPYDMYAMTAAHTILPIPSYVRVTNPENGRSVVVRVNDRGPFLHDRLIDLSYVAAQKLGIAQKGSGIVDIEWIDTRPGAVVNYSPSTPNTTSSNQNPSGVYVQVGAFKSPENADRMRENLQSQSLTIAEDGRNVPVQNWYNDDTYRVRLGPYMNRSEAVQAADRINQNLGTNAIVVIQN